MGEYKKISDYAVIGDMHSAALVGLDGSVDWCCFPRFDSPSVFAALLDSGKGGRFRLSPKGKHGVTQAYEKDSNVLTTAFKAPGGEAKLTDFMPCFMQEGKLRTFSAIVRVLEVLDGDLKFLVDYQPRLNYGIGETVLERRRSGDYVARDGESMVTLSSSVELEGAGVVMSAGSLSGEFKLAVGEKAFFVVKYGSGRRLTRRTDVLEHDLSRTTAFWRGWAGHIKYDGRWREHVLRSALVLKLLQYAPTGALVASVTTSLPETIGGERNWDYRYSWVRDTAFSLWALDEIGATREAIDYGRWLVKARSGRGMNTLEIMERIRGEDHLGERTLDHLEGYKGSRPVRIGNAAHDQLQLDMYGALVDSIYFLHKMLGWTNKRIYEYLVRDAADFVVKTWKKPDHGIWEMRTDPKFLVESRVWCYVALDRAVRLATELGYEDDVGRWDPVKKQIKEEVLSKGWSEKKQAFAMEYGGDELDAANLLIPLLHFLPSDDPRVSSTVMRIREELAEGDLVYRYRIDDGLKGKEGAFTVCSFWLADCLVRLGHVKEAEGMLERLIGRANHVGLYSEQIDPKTGAALGNFPQAYTHMGLISSILTLEAATKKKRK